MYPLINQGWRGGGSTRLGTLFYDYSVIQWEKQPSEQRRAPKDGWWGGVEAHAQLPRVPLTLRIFSCPVPFCEAAPTEMWDGIFLLQLW